MAVFKPLLADAKRDESHCARSEIICQNFRLCLKKCFFV